ncbi:hypothetical protein ACOMHN_041258 [Nucella lapillus]
MLQRSPECSCRVHSPECSRGVMHVIAESIVLSAPEKSCMLLQIHSPECSRGVLPVLAESIVLGAPEEFYMFLQSP